MRLGDHGWRRAGVLRRRAVVAPVLGLALAFTAVSAAQADDDMPSAQDVQRARDAVSAKTDEVTAIRARIAAAADRVNALSVDAAAAAEAYNGAQYALRRAERSAARAKAASDSAARAAERERLVVERLAVSGVTARAPYNRLRSFFSEDGPSAMLGQISAYDAVGDASRAAMAAYQSKRAVATTMKRRADSAVAKREKLAGAAEKAKESAESAAARSGLEQDRDRLIRELADAEGISVTLARKRQRALEKLAEQAQQNANLPRTGTPALPPADSSAPPAADPDPQPADDPAPDPAPDPQPDPAPQPDPDPAPKPNPKPPKPARGVEAAIRFAMAQVGEPYVWAGAGPDVWDCSGLTMRAWQAGGKSLPHYSGAQYASSIPISLSKARRGDLLFWSRGGPGSIYHVALYLGDGWMIEAPRPGKNVQVVSVYSWTAPDLAARVR